MDILSLILQILKNGTEFLNRETNSDEKIKDNSVKTVKDYKKAVFFARQIFDGKRKFAGLDVLLKDKLSPEDYKMYKKLRESFNKFS